MDNMRKNYFIKKEFQTKFILKFCALVTLAAVISAVVLYLFLSHSVTTVFKDSRIMIKPTTEFIMPGLIFSSLISVILVSLATVAVVVFISHRIAGPLYKVENSLERMGEGDVSFDIHFRRGDEVKVLSEIFNKTRRKLSGTVADMKKESTRIFSQINALKKISDKSTAESHEIKKILDGLEKTSGDLGEKFNKFKL